MSLTLYFHPLSSYCQKALIALYENDTPFTPNIVNLMDPAGSAAFKKLWPCGQFPVLVDDGGAISESTVIIEHLDAYYPGKTRFIPSDPEMARQVRLKDRFFDLHLHVHMQKVVGDHMRPEGKKDPHGVEQARARMNVSLDMIDANVPAGPGRWATPSRWPTAPRGPPLFYIDRVFQARRNAQERRRLPSPLDGASVLRPRARRGAAVSQDVSSVSAIRSSAMTATADTLPMARDVALTRVLDAPRDLVCGSINQPVRMAQWWGPHHFTNPVCEIDARAGGRFLVHMKAPDGTVYPMTGTFTEVVKPERLRFKAFAEALDGTRYLESDTAGDLRAGRRPDPADGEGQRQGAAPGRAADARRHGGGLEPEPGEARLIWSQGAGPGSTRPRAGIFVSGRRTNPTPWPLYSDHSEDRPCQHPNDPAKSCP